MEYGVIDNSGVIEKLDFTCLRARVLTHILLIEIRAVTDDDNAQPVYTRVPLGSRVAGNGRSFIAAASYQMMQIDMESEIHNLEQIAYGAVLRAFKAQSNALTWEKEGLITELRKELRVSDDEHRELLTEVNADDLIRRIREWREAGGSHNVGPNGANNQLQSPTVSASRKRPKASLSGNPFGAQSQTGQPAIAPAKPVQHQFIDHISSGVPVDDLSESVRDSLVGRRVMIRWPADNNFYEALITEYNPVDGCHSLVYDSNTPNATLEWVNIKEVPPEDIRWVGDDPVTFQLGEMGGPNSGRRRLSSMNPFAKEIRLPVNEVIRDDYEEIEILHTDTLIKKVEKVLDATHPDLAEIHKAKKMLKEHEQTLIQVIEKLAAVCDSDDDRPSEQGLSGGQITLSSLS
ncbi:Emsy N Terminus (ENT)/ plant Tudor-likedomains-containing protein [Striga asiatica]|uniref:Emsy N Terminus (ENT)/ plant Tudor-likedomains-containing protein n=1 Tax=Striga asiatica TaxID=4170 RepID=A0A5A7Q7A6_STRAF|nr:Emsy N Terminus (ENT)/ plant Tudor-likedomains-containing protein [Striga asiatica]